MAESSAKPFYLKLPVLIASLIILVVVVGGAVYFYLRSTNSSLLGSSPQNTQAETKALVAKVGKIYELPTNEVPTIATVSDVAKLSGQDFFKHAENGDKVLIYTQAKKAILYRPSTNKIVEVGPVNIQPTPAAQSSSSTSANVSTTPGKEKTVKVALYNGTTTTGLTLRMETDLKNEKAVTADVIARENAAKQDYPGTIVIDLTGKQADAAKQLATFTKGKVAPLPAGEAKPTGADILIILGEDYATSSK